MFSWGFANCQEPDKCTKLSKFRRAQRAGGFFRVFWGKNLDFQEILQWEYTKAKGVFSWGVVNFWIRDKRYIAYSI